MGVIGIQILRYRGKPLPFNGTSNYAPAGGIILKSPKKHHKNISTPHL